MERRPVSFNSGYVYLCLAALLWASSGLVAKLLFRTGISPLELVQLRSTIAFLTLLPCLVLLRPGLLSAVPGDIPYYLITGAALAAMQFTYLLAVSRIHLAAAVLLQYQAPVLITCYEFACDRSRLPRFALPAVAGAAAGCYLMVGAYSLDLLDMNRTGIVAGLASAASFALYSLRSEEGMRSRSPWTVLFYSMAVAAILWNIMQPPLAAFSARHSVREWFGILFVCVFGTIIPFGLYNEGVSRIRSVRASVTATLEPVMAGGLAFLLLGEVLRPLQMLGGALVICSIVLLKMKGN